MDDKQPIRNIDSIALRHQLRDLANHLKENKGEFLLLIGQELCIFSGLPSRSMIVEQLKLKLASELSQELLLEDANEPNLSVEVLFEELGWFGDKSIEYAEAIHRAFTNENARNEFIASTFDGDSSEIYIIIANLIKNGFFNNVLYLAGDELLEDALSLLGESNYRTTSFGGFEEYPKITADNIQIIRLHEYYLSTHLDNLVHLAENLSEQLYTLIQTRFSDYGLVIVGFDGVEPITMPMLTRTISDNYFTKGIYWIISENMRQDLEANLAFQKLRALNNPNFNPIFIKDYQYSLKMLHDYLDLTVEELGWDENWEGIHTYKQNLLAMIEQYRKSHELLPERVPVLLEEFQLSDTGTKKNYDIQTIYKRFPKFLILGDAGTGKTTLLHDLCRRLCEIETGQIPILVKLREYQGDILELVKSSFLGELDFRTLNIGLRRGKFVLVFDGLNEVSERYFDLLMNELNRLTTASTNQRSNFIITSRDYRFERRLDNFKVFTVKPIDKEVVNDYLITLLGSRSKAHIRKLMESSVYAMCSNVMMLTLLVKAYDTNGKFPSNQADLYEQFINSSLDYVKSRSSKNEKYDALIFLANDMGASRVTLPLLEARRSLAVHLSSDNQTYDSLTLEKSTQLIHELLRDRMLVQHSGSLAFFHQSIQDYLIAKRIAAIWKINNKNEDVIEFARDARNYEILIFTAGVLDSADSLIKELIDINIYLAVRCIGGARKVSHDIVNSAIDNLVQLFRGEYSSRSVFEALAYLGERSVIPSSKFLKENRAEFRHFVDYMLKLLEPSNALEPLHSMIENQSDEHVQLHIAEAICKLQIPKNIPLLMNLFLTSDSKPVIIRALVLHALLRVRSSIGEMNFAKQLDSVNLRFFSSGEANETLIGLTDELMEIARHHRKYYFRAHACAALGEIGDNRAVITLANALLHDEKWNVRFRSARALGAIGDRRAIFPLSEAIKTDEDHWVRGHAAEALAQIGDLSILPTLELALNDSSEFVKMAVQDSIENISRKTN